MNNSAKYKSWTEDWKRRGEGKGRREEQRGAPGIRGLIIIIITRNPNPRNLKERDLID